MSRGGGRGLVSRGGGAELMERAGVFFFFSNIIGDFHTEPGSPDAKIATESNRIQDFCSYRSAPTRCLSQ